MKRALLLFLSIGLFVSLQAQITMEPAQATGWADLDDLSTDPHDVKAHISITNNSTETKSFRWVLTILDQPSEWAAAVCDVNACYNPGTVFEDFDLAPNQTSIMDTHVYPSGDIQTLAGAVPGVGTYSIKVTEIGNSDNTTTGEYEITVVGNPITSLNELEIAQLRLFPNPATDFFQLEGPDGVEKITLYNLLGRELAQYQVNESQYYDISQLPIGLFLAALEDKEGRLLKTMRLQRR